MILYEGHFETQDGEHEYTAIEYVLAQDLEDAWRYFVGFLSTYFGEDGETLVVERDNSGFASRVENDWGTLAAKLDYVAHAHRLIVPTTDGGSVLVDLEVKNE